MQQDGTKNLSPTTLSVDGKTLNKPIDIANAINIAQISRNIRLHRDIPKSNIDHQQNYKKLVKNKNLDFKLKTINMNELKKVIKEIKPGSSAGVDGISSKTLKQIIKPLLPALLNLVNTSMTTATYPNILKTSRIVPLRKNNKPENDPISYRAVNILPSIDKVIDKVICKQLTRHLTSNNLILQQHHGSVKNRSTMTAILSMLDEWSEALEKGDNSAIMVLDQSAAYDVICHTKLIEKLKILGLDQNAILYFKDYLQGRRQTVTVDTFQSQTLETGPLSVCQGSTLSGLLYLVYTLDYPLIHTKNILTIEEYDKSVQPKTTTFVDDSIVRIHLEDDPNRHNEQIREVQKKISNYMHSNKLVINNDKTKLLIITKKNEIRNQIELKVDGIEKPIKPLRNFLYLGVRIQDDLKWNQHLADGPENMTKKLQQKLNAVKLIRRYMGVKTTKMVLNGIFMSVIYYGACLWIGAPHYLKDKIQKLQLDACRLTIGRKADRWSKKKLLQEMNWLPVNEILKKESILMTHKIMKTNNPEHMHYKMFTKYKNYLTKETRQTGMNNLGNLPKQIGNSKTTQYHYRVSAYKIFNQIPEELRLMNDPKIFKRWVNRYLTNPKNLPSLIKKKKEMTKRKK